MTRESVLLNEGFNVSGEAIKFTCLWLGPRGGKLGFGCFFLSAMWNSKDSRAENNKENGITISSPLPFQLDHQKNH